MFSLHILYFTLVFSFPSVLATLIVKQYFGQHAPVTTFLHVEFLDTRFLSSY